MSTEEQKTGARGERPLTQREFDELLAWLDEEREQAGQRYEEIRRRLIKFFTCRGCPESEDLADETINRVARKVSQIAADYHGDKALYFHGVARLVHLEYRHKLHRAGALPPAPQPSDEVERTHMCLEECLARLDVATRRLVVQYYRGQGRAKIRQRQQLAAQLGIALNALRIRACRIREKIYQCMQGCLARTAD